jgi:lactate dehydrogenase-like 2-hydroxyacid dehydrogenase
MCEQAAMLGIRFAPLAGGGTEVTPGQAGERLAELRPAGYLMNYPRYGPRLSGPLADAAGGSLRIVTYLGATRELAAYEPFFDVAALRERGIVLTSPAIPCLAVAESALTMLFALDLGLVGAHRAATAAGDRAGDRAGDGGQDITLGTRAGLLGSTLGIVGLGQIGQRVAQLATAWGMRVCYASRTRRPGLEDLLGVRHVSLPALAEQADHITVHTPITTTRGLIDRGILSRARGINLVNNTADPRIVEPEALLTALRSGWVRRAAIEGCYPEPHQQALRELDDGRVLLLPAYTSWGNTAREQDRTWQQQLETYRAFLTGRRSRDELS